MEHKAGMVDVANKRCEMCTKQLVFNMEGEGTARLCGDHKDIDMVDVRASGARGGYKEASILLFIKTIQCHANVNTPVVPSNHRSTWRVRRLASAVTTRRQVW